MNIEATAGIEAVETVGHCINGAKVADHGRSPDLFHPATGTVTRQVAPASKGRWDEARAAPGAAWQYARAARWIFSG